MRPAIRTFGSARDRWAGLGPYYAMFPTTFADRVIQDYTSLGDGVLDPFAGRGTSIFSAAVQGRKGIGIERNPVGWIYAKTKLQPADAEQVLTRLQELSRSASQYRSSAHAMPEFFRMCYAQRVREFLLATRARLNWRGSCVDRTLMALLLVYLHGKYGASLSNQMRQTKSMSPQYAVNWWRQRGMVPPEIEPEEFMASRIEWRYAKGVPDVHGSRVLRGESQSVLRTLSNERGLNLLFTSPPYYGLTNYHYDQWLRIWLLGGPPHARRFGGAIRGKCENRVEYEALLRIVFSRSKPLLAPDATVYVRTDRRKITYSITRRVLKEVFPEKRIVRRTRPLHHPTQTQLFGDMSQKPGEVDLIAR